MVDLPLYLTVIASQINLRELAKAKSELQDKLTELQVANEHKRVTRAPATTAPLATQPNVTNILKRSSQASVTKAAKAGGGSIGICAGAAVAIQASAFGMEWATEYAASRGVSVSICTLTGTVMGPAVLEGYTHQKRWWVHFVGQAEPDNCLEAHLVATSHGNSTQPPLPPSI